MSYAEGSPSRCCVGERETENNPRVLSHLPSAWPAFLLPPSFRHGAPPEAGWVQTTEIGAPAAVVRETKGEQVGRRAQ